MAIKGIIARRRRNDGLIGNFLAISNHTGYTVADKAIQSNKADPLSEDNIKSALEKWLNENGWSTNIAWGRMQGIDIDATRESDRWIIEVKGRGSRNAMRVNYFLAVLGETLQRMNDPNAKYSIALPDLEQYRSLWERLPKLAKARTAISAISVSKNGNVTIDSAK